MKLKKKRFKLCESWDFYAHRCSCSIILQLHLRHNVITNFFKSNITLKNSGFITGVRNHSLTSQCHIAEDLIFSYTTVGTSSVLFILFVFSVSGLDVAE